jgi:hypothetical protein
MAQAGLAAGGYPTIRELHVPGVLRILPHLQSTAPRGTPTIREVNEMAAGDCPRAQGAVHQISITLREVKGMTAAPPVAGLAASRPAARAASRPASLRRRGPIPRTPGTSRLAPWRPETPTRGTNPRLLVHARGPVCRPSTSRSGPRSRRHLLPTNRVAMTAHSACGGGCAWWAVTPAGRWRPSRESPSWPCSQPSARWR